MKNQKNRIIAQRHYRPFFLACCVWFMPLWGVAGTSPGVSESEAVQQQRRISGIVSDKDGEPIVGATVRVSGTNTGAVTDANGRYHISAGSGQTLEFTYVGYKTSAVKVSASSNIDVVMFEDAIMLGPVEVVPIGYGTMRRSDITGSVVSVTSETLERSVITSLDQALQGQAAGLQMTQNSGIPGGSTSIQIRGISSINNSSEPIYVIDGVVISAHTGSITRNAIADINPNDIESIEILKDASATAIYGAQAANGVILISMKKGRNEQPKINFNYYYGLQQLSNKIEMSDLRGYALLYNDQYDLGFHGWYKSYLANPETLGRGTDWQDEIFRDAETQSFNLSIRGGNKQTSYSISGSYLMQDGIVVSSSFERMTLRLALESQVRDWLRVGSTVNLSNTDQDSGMASWSFIGNALYQAPSVPAVNIDGSYGGPDANDSNLSDFSNPIAIAAVTTRNTGSFGARGNIFTLITPVKWLNIRSEFSADGGLNQYKYFLPEYEFGYSVNSYATTERQKTWNIYTSLRNTATADYTFAKKHKVTAMVGQEITYRKRDYLMGRRTHGSSELQGLDAGDANYSTNAGNGYTSKFSSFFGRLFYGFDDKYLLTYTVRRDGSSNFARGHRFGTFQSFAGAWRINKESFLKNAGWLDNLKLRVGYGEVGNANVSAYAYESMLANVMSNWGIALKTSNIPNKDLTWETTKAWNVGLDVNLLGQRIELIAEMYRKKTDDLLMQLSLPGYVGTEGQGSAATQWANIGSLENKGFEFTLNTVNIRKRKFQWQTGVTFSLNRNKILSLNTENGYINRTYDLGGNSSIITRTQAGHPVSQFYGYRAIGRINSWEDMINVNGDGTYTVKIATPTWQKGYTTTNLSEFTSAYTYIGDLIFADVTEDGKIDENDTEFIGSPLPKFTYGINNKFTVGNFDISVFLYGSQGNKVFNWLNRRLDDPNSSGNHLKRTVNYAKFGYLDENSSNTGIDNVYVLPVAGSNQTRMAKSDPNNNVRVSSRFVEDASFLRVQNITVGYNLPRRLSSRLRMERLRLYGQIQNLHTFTKYEGYDPEVGSTQGQYSYSGQDMLLYGVDTGRYPSPRIFTLGIDITF